MSILLTIIIPYYNERDYLAATLRSLGCQSCRDFCLILVDNASTDGSAEIARTVMADYPDIATQFLHNSCPGQLPTLEHGLAAVTTAFVASCDADTIYPPHYVATCLDLFQCHDGSRPVAGVMAIDLYSPAGSSAAKRRIAKIMRKSRIFSSQCHAGGYAHAYRTDLLRRSGGFESRGWPYLLYDHEVYERVRVHGEIRYSPNHYCFPSERRSDRRSVSWNWLERTVYRFTPGPFKNWFFYQFLAKRLAHRGLVQVKLRDRDF
ncbi:glycosyltransferase family 2 protein [Sphingobium mellinum]|uniref:glycosyltransferase family 2 protein n=1 Tax=Sphingobium mellinum TaxID=1387166 RepID=UPI0030EDA62D